MANLVVFTPISYEKDGEKKTNWVRIGRAFKNKDGSLSIALDALPINGRLNVRVEDQQQRSNGGSNGNRGESRGGGQREPNRQQQQREPGDDDEMPF